MVSPSTSPRRAGSAPPACRPPQPSPTSNGGANSLPRFFVWTPAPASTIEYDIRYGGSAPRWSAHARLRARHGRSRGAPAPGAAAPAPLAPRPRGAHRREPQHALGGRAGEQGADDPGTRPHRDRARHQHRPAARGRACGARGRAAPRRARHGPRSVGLGAADPLPRAAGRGVRADADDHSGGRRRRRVRPARPGLARVPRDGARRAQAHARWRGARAPCRRQHLLRRRLPPRVRQCGPRAVRLLPGDGARPPSWRRATRAPEPRPQEVNAMTAHPDKSAPPALEPEHFRRLAHAAVDLAADYLAGIAAMPVFRPMSPAERAGLMQEPLAAGGAEPEAVLERFRAAVLPHAMGNGHPRFFGWVNSPPAPIGVVADLLAATLNPSCAGGDHAAIYVERAAVRWLMELIGFPTEGSMGLLASGGSAAT